MLSRNLFRFYFKKNSTSNLLVTTLHRNNSSNIAHENVIKSKVPNLVIPNITMDEYVWRNLDKWHDKTAVICAETNRSYIYSDLYRKSWSLTNFLHKFKGIRQGDTIAVVLPNVPEFLIVTLAANQAGLKLTTVNPLYNSSEIAKQFSDSETKLIFTLNQCWVNVNAAVKATSRDIPVVIVNTREGASIPAGTIKFDELLNEDHRNRFNITRKPEDVILLPYSSGTTGHPKGVEITNRNAVANLTQASVKEFKVTLNAKDTIPAILPMFHIFGLALAINSVACGNKLITVPRFTSEVFINILRDYKPTIGYLVPPLVMFLINHPSIRFQDIESLRKISCGAAPLGAADIERFYKKTKEKIVLIQAYGMSETSPMLHSQSEVLPNGIKVGGCGFLIPNTECKIVSTDEEKEGMLLGPNQSGELHVRGPQVMKGYLNNPQGTREILDEDGWLRTGDIGYYDEDEHFFITDRLKELIKVKGFQVPPAELEELLRNHPDIQDAAVVGIPHKEFGEVPKAFVVAKRDSKANSHKIQEYVAAKVVQYKQLLGGVVFLESIPKSATGKILRRQLKEI